MSTLVGRSAAFTLALGLCLCVAACSSSIDPLLATATTTASPGEPSTEVPPTVVAGTPAELAEEALAMESLETDRIWHGSELIEPDGSRTILVEGPWIWSRPAFQSPQPAYAGSIGGCVMDKLGFVVRDGFRLVTDPELDTQAGYACDAVPLPEDVVETITAIVFDRPLIEFSSDGSTVSLVGDAGEVVFRSLAGAAEQALGSTPGWAAVSIDGVQLDHSLMLGPDGRVGGCLTGTESSYTVSQDTITARLDVGPAVPDAECAAVEPDPAASELATAVLEASPRVGFRNLPLGQFEMVLAGAGSVIVFEAVTGL